MYYRILSAPPGYAPHQRYMVASYRTLEYECVENVVNADGSKFFATIEEARNAIPADAMRLPFDPEHQFLELWETRQGG